MALAFELPEHLPRSGQALDKSTSILNRVAQASNRSLNAALAASWLSELEQAIHDIEVRTKCSTSLSLTPRNRHAYRHEYVMNCPPLSDSSRLLHPSKLAWETCQLVLTTLLIL